MAADPPNAAPEIVQTPCLVDVQEPGVLPPPVHRLPAEIISDIFLWTFIRGMPPPVPCIAKSPLLLFRVCSRWRHIALGTPGLWAALKLSFKGSLQADHEGVMLDNWLTRAGACPLSLFFVADTCYPNCKGGNEGPALLRSLDVVTETIIPHLQRCCSLRLRLPLAHTRQLCEHFANGMPYLQDLFLSSLPSREVIPIDLSSCPRLTNLTVAPFYKLQPSLPPGHNLFRDLASLSLFSGLDKAWQILNNSPSIATCTIVFMEVGDIGAGSPSSLGLSSLTKLTISTSNQVDPADFFDRLYLPSLKSLILDFGFENARDSWPHLNGMLQRSKPPLEVLSIYSVKCSEDELLECLRHVPSLQTFSVWDSHERVGDSLWIALTDPGDCATDVLAITARRIPSVCPCLQELAVQYCGPQDRRLVQSMVQSRYREFERYPLHSLTLSICGFSQDELCDTAEFRRCLDAGLKVTVSA